MMTSESAAVQGMQAPGHESWPRAILAHRRSYCRQEPEVQQAVEFLDEQQEAGWLLIERLLSGEQSVSELLSSPALKVG